jgi:hypothetical protein
MNGTSGVFVTGLSPRLALTIFSNQTALPATVSSVFMIVWIIRLAFKERRPME